MDPDRDDERLPGLQALPREVTPDRALEDRTVQALGRAGLLRPPVGRTRRLWSLAAALALFVGGAALGRATTPSPDVVAPGVPRFMLLLQGGPHGLSASEESAVVAEYRAWAIGLREQGRFVTGERLAEPRASVPDGSPGAEELRGFFLISAVDLADAREIARGSPHARRGGQVIVRPIG